MGEINAKENIIRLMSQYQNLVFSICLKLTGDYFTAQDLTQETFLAAFRSWDTFDGGSEKAWLCRIAANKCVDYHRASIRNIVPVQEEEMEELEATGRDGPLQQVLNKEVMEELHKSCNALPPPYNEVARLHFVEGKTAKEIAEITGLLHNTVKTQIHRAREMLRKSFRKELLQE